MSILSKKGIVKIVRGILTSKLGGPDITTLREGLTEESKCGFGLDYCRGGVRYKDHATGVHYIRYVKDGSIAMKTVEDFDSQGA